MRRAPGRSARTAASSLSLTRACAARARGARVIASACASLGSSPQQVGAHQLGAGNLGMTPCRAKLLERAQLRPQRALERLELALRLALLRLALLPPRLERPLDRIVRQNRLIQRLERLLNPRVEQSVALRVTLSRRAARAPRCHVVICCRRLRGRRQWRAGAVLALGWPWPSAANDTLISAAYDREAHPPDGGAQQACHLCGRLHRAIIHGTDYVANLQHARR